MKTMKTLTHTTERIAHTATPDRLGRRWLPGVAGAALAAVGMSRRSPAGAALAIAGGALAYAGVSGRTPLPDWLRSRLPRAEAEGLVVRRAITIQRPAEELYAFWRDFEHLPRFMGYVRSVTVQDPGGRSHWVASGPAGTTVEWDARIVAEEPNSLIRWESLPGARVANRGEVRFQPAPAGRGTEVRVRLEYEPPAGMVGATLAQVLGQGADRQVRESLRNFKQLMEAGEIPTNDHQPMGTCLNG